MSILKLEEIKSLTGTGNTVITFDSSDRAVFAQPPLTAVPTFSVQRTTDQTSVSPATDTKVAFNSVDFDTNSFWDSSNYRYTPQIAGYYQFNTVIRFLIVGGLTSLARVMLFKNGSVVVSTYVQLSQSIINNSHLGVSHLIYCNGSTDYVESYGWIQNGTQSSLSFGGGSVSTNGSIFSGFLVRAGAA